MARSYKKTKVFGNTSAPSEKRSKRITNKKFRRHNKVKLKKEDNDLWFKHDEAYNKWSMEKDGKVYWKEAKSKHMRK